MAHYLVTGGAGFIGSHLARRLLRDGHRVRVLDNLSTGRLENIADILQDIEYRQGDLRHEPDCLEACRDVDTVFHQAALPSVPKSIVEPARFHANNVGGTFQLLMAAKECGCRRVIYAGSSSVYGDLPELPKREALAPAPRSPYAVGKLMGEYYCTVFWHAYQLETMTLRYFNVFGEQQDPGSDYAAAIPAFVSALLRGQAPLIYGDGEQTRDFTHIDNVVQANVLAAGVPRAAGEVLNVACGERITINDVVDQVGRLLGTDIRPSHQAPRPGDVRHSCADISRAREVIGYQPSVSFAEGLARTIEWYRNHL